MFLVASGCRFCCGQQKAGFDKPELQREIGESDVSTGHLSDCFSRTPHYNVGLHSQILTGLDKAAGPDGAKTGHTTQYVLFLKAQRGAAAAAHLRGVEKHGLTSPHSSRRTQILTSVEMEMSDPDTVNV